MAKYIESDAPIGLDPRRSAEPEPTVKLNATEARQGLLGRPVLAVLIGGLVLALLAWAAVEFWAVSVTPNQPQPTATEKAVTPNQPSGAGSFNDNQPAGAKVEPAPAIDEPASNIKNN